MHTTPINIPYFYFFSMVAICHIISSSPRLNLPTSICFHQTDISLHTSIILRIEAIDIDLLKAPLASLMATITPNLQKLVSQARSIIPPDHHYAPVSDSVVASPESAFVHIQDWAFLN